MDERTGPLHVDVDAEEANVGPTQEDPVVAFQRARRRKRQKWWLGLAALAVGGAAWAAYAYWPLPTVRIRAEVDVTCPMEIGAEIHADDDRGTAQGYATASPPPNTPGQTFVFELDGAPRSTVQVRAEVPEKRWKEARACQGEAVRIFADGELVFEGLTTAGQSLTCWAYTGDRWPRPAISRPFANRQAVPVYVR